MRWFGSDRRTRPRKRGGSVIIHHGKPAGGSQDHDVVDRPIGDFVPLSSTEATVRAELQRVWRKIFSLEAELEFMLRYPDAEMVQARIGEVSKKVAANDGPNQGACDELMALLKYAHRRGFIKGTED